MNKQAADLRPNEGKQVGNQCPSPRRSVCSSIVHHSHSSAVVYRVDLEASSHHFALFRFAWIPWLPETAPDIRGKPPH